MFNFQSSSKDIAAYHHLNCWHCPRTATAKLSGGAAKPAQQGMLLLDIVLSFQNEHFYQQSIWANRFAESNINISQLSVKNPQQSTSKLSKRYHNVSGWKAEQSERKRRLYEDWKETMKKASCDIWGGILHFNFLRKSSSSSITLVYSSMPAFHF